MLALPLVLTTACGDNLSGPVDPSTDGTDEQGAAETEWSARYLPEVCGVHAFPTVQVDAKDTMVRAVPYASGTALFTVPKGGGVVRGLERGLQVIRGVTRG